MELTYENVKKLQKTHTVAEMGAVFGISRTTMGRRLSELGLAKPKDRIDIKNSDILNDWNNGLTIVEIARKYNCSHDTITKRLKKMGIRSNRVDGIKRHFKRVHNDMWPDIKSDLDAGMNLTAVREKHKIRHTKLVELMKINSYAHKGASTFDNLLNRIEFVKSDTTRRKNSVTSELMYLESIREYWLKHDELPTAHDICEMTNLTRVGVMAAIKRYGLYEFVRHTTSSKLVLLIINDLRKLGLDFELNNRRVLRTNDMHREIDIYLPDFKLGIEINPVATHSIDSKMGVKSKSYHQEKSLLAEECGVGLIHFYDADYYDKRKYNVFLNQLRALTQSKTRIGARDCDVVKIDARESNVFLNKFHFQGAERSSSVRYGLYFGSILVGVMTFGTSRYTENEYELIRYCMDPNYVVMGGFAKLFKQASCDWVSGTVVVSYMDLNKRLRPHNVYEQHGFTYSGITQPDYVWVKHYGTETLTRYATMKSKLVKLGYDASNTEVEIMRSRDYFRVFGSGSKRYVYTV